MKMISRKINSALRNCDVTANVKTLHGNFVFKPIDKAAYNVAIVGERLQALVILIKLD